MDVEIQLIFEFDSEDIQNSHSFQYHLQILPLTNAVKEIIAWFRKTDYEDDVSNYWNFTQDGSSDTSEAIQGSKHWPQALRTMNLNLNQQRLYGEGRDAMYFSYLLPKQVSKFKTIRPS